MDDFKIMLAHKYDPARLNWRNVSAERKLDGVRIIITVDRVLTPRYYSRNGRQLFVFSHLDGVMIEARKQLAKHNDAYLTGAMFDGEMTRKKFSQIAGTIHRKDFTDEKARFHCFHVMPLQRFKQGLDSQAQSMRKEEIARLCHCKEIKRSRLFNQIEPIPVLNDEEAVELYKQARRDKVEGVIIKDLAKPWIAKRDHAWMKMKEELSADVAIIGFNKGKGKYKNTLGSLVVDHNGVIVTVAGMSDKWRDDFWKNQTHYFERMIEVSYQEETENGSLRHPRFKRLRPDRD